MALGIYVDEKKHQNIDTVLQQLIDQSLFRILYMSSKPHEIFKKIQKQI